MKHLLSLLLLIPSLQTFSFTGDVEIDGIEYYVVTKGNDAEVIGCNSTITDLVIPEEIEYDGVKCAVTKIRHRAFIAHSQLTTAFLPNSIEIIDHFAFAHCNNLTSINIPSSVTSLGEGVFYKCDKLQTVNISDISQWLKIFNYEDTFTDQYRLYLNGEELKDLLVPEDIEKIRIGTFQNCLSLNHVSFHGNISSIADRAFSGCAELREIELPDNIKTVGRYAFAGCSSLSSIVLPNQLETISFGTFYGCNSIKSLFIPEGVCSIKESAFYNCSSIEKIYLPSTLQSISAWAFRGCTELLDVYVNRENPPSLQFTFDNDVKYVKLHVPESSLDKYKKEYGWRDFGSIIPLADEFTGINTLTSTTYLDYYTIDGHHMKAPAKGVNIIRERSGRARKVVVR